MEIRPGMTIRSSPELDGSFFEGAHIYIVEHNEKGSIGFVLNKPDGRYLNQLEEFSHCPPIPLLEGGPVDHDHLYLLHSRPDLVSGGTLVEGDKYWGGKMDDVMKYLRNGQLQPQDLKIFIGYCGWDAGELEQEATEGSWLPTSNPQ